MAAEIPVSAIRRQIASGIDLIVHLARMRDKSRKVIEITEVAGIKGEEVSLNPIYQFRETKMKEKEKVEGELVLVGKMVYTHKMEAAGISEDRE